MIFLLIFFSPVLIILAFIIPIFYKAYKWIPIIGLYWLLSDIIKQEMDESDPAIIASQVSLIFIILVILFIF